MSISFAVLLSQQDINNKQAVNDETAATIYALCFRFVDLGYDSKGSSSSLRYKSFISDLPEACQLSDFPLSRSLELFDANYSKHQGESSCMHAL